MKSLNIAIAAALCALFAPGVLAQDDPGADAPAEVIGPTFTADLTGVPMDRFLWHEADPAVRFWSPEAGAAMACRVMGDDGVIPLGGAFLLAVLQGGHGDYDETPVTLGVAGEGMVSCDGDESLRVSEETGIGTLIVEYWENQYDQVPDLYAVRFIDDALSVERLGD